jgi:hypothetical protein
MSVLPLSPVSLTTGRMMGTGTGSGTAIPGMPTIVTLSPSAPVTW